jgi:hypothetical protein
LRNHNAPAFLLLSGYGYARYFKKPAAVSLAI